MSSGSTYTGSNFRLLSASQLSGTTIRLRYSHDPIATSDSGAYDALNAANYVLSGPAANAISSIVPVAGDPQGFDLYTESLIIEGSWTITVSNVKSDTNITISDPVAIVFDALRLKVPGPLSQGALNDSQEKIIRNFLSPALKGQGWDAVIAALAVGDAYVKKTTQAAADQFYKSTASGIYLDRILSDDGFPRPINVGMSDRTYRNLGIKLGATKIVLQPILEALEAYYGDEATRAYSVSSVAEPYVLIDGDQLLVQIDEGQVTPINFERDDFGRMGAATAAEVAAAITRGLRNQGGYAYSLPYKDATTGENYVRIFSGALGLGGAVRIKGGRAQNQLKFPTEIETLQTVGTQWDIVPATATNGILAGRVRVTWVGGTSPQLQKVIEGNYVNIYGAPFQEANRGAFDIVATTPTYFEIVNVGGESQSAVTQLAADDIVFYESTKRSIQSVPRMSTAVQGSTASVDIVLPTTTDVIEREVNKAAYLHRQDLIPVVAGSRAVSGVATITTDGAHELSVGDWFFADDLIPDLTTSNPFTAFTDTGPTTTFDDAAIALLPNGKVLVCGGAGPGVAFDDVWVVGAAGAMRRYDGAHWGSFSSGVAQSLNDIWGFLSTDIWAVGAENTFIRWNGSSWSPVAISFSAAADNLLAVFAPSSTEAWMSGYLMQRWNGTAWSTYTMPGFPFPSYQTADMHGSAANNIMRCGAGGKTSLWNGSVWSNVSCPTVENLYGIFVTGVGTGWTVGDSGQVMKMTGGTWNLHYTSAGGDLRGVWSGSSGLTWAVGRGVGALAGIYYWDGASWVSQAVPAGGHRLYDVWGFGTGTEVWAVGDGGKAHRYSAGTWTNYATGFGGILQSVWGSATNDVWAVGTGGTILHWNGSAWSTVSSGTTDDIYCVNGSSSSDVWAVTFTGLVLHWDGYFWSGGSTTFNAVWGTATNNAWAVGDIGTIMHWDGSSWTSYVGGGHDNLYGVEGAATNDVWACGATGTIRHWDGSSWSASVSGVATQLNNLAVVSANDVWAVGASGVIRHWNGSAWSASTSGTAENLNDVKSVATNSVWAVGNNGTILHWNGSAWSSSSSGTGNNLNDINVIAANNIWVTGDSGTILHWNGSAWSSSSSGTGSNLLGIFGTTSTPSLSDTDDAFLYDPEANTWSLAGVQTDISLIPASGKMNLARSGHTATVLENGNVLVVGGHSSNGAAEIYDYVSDTWTTAGTAAAYHRNHTACLLNDGKVMVVGGAAITAETYDPETATWTTITSPSTIRNHHAGVTLRDGRVLICGGYNGSSVALSSAEVYNPTNNTWMSASAMSTNRVNPGIAATRRGTSGDVYVFGGNNGTSNISSVESFNPSTLAWTARTAMSSARKGFDAITLLDGKIFLGFGAGSPTSVEIYDVVNGTTLPETAVASGSHTSARSALMSGGDVIIVGGQSTTPEVWSKRLAVTAAGGMNGLFCVTEVPGSTQFKYLTSTTEVTTLLSGGTILPMKQTSNNIQGPFIFEEKTSPAITGIKTTLTQDVSKGQTVKILTLADVSKFPDSEGYLVIGFGTDDQMWPVKYLARISSTQLLMDPNFVFPEALSSGISVTLLLQRGAWSPLNANVLGSFYLTASSAGRLAASNTIDDIVGAGLNINKIVVYPGDKGLGGEGLPATGVTKLSDKVGIWGSDDITEDLDKAREE